MKKIIILILIASSHMVYSQRVAFIESEYILSKVKTYAVANEKIEQISQEWRTDIDSKMQNLDLMYKKFQAEQSLYTAKMKQDKIQEIETYEKQIATLQQSRFGQSGELFKKRQELLQPIISKMMDVVKSIAERKSFDLVLDKSSGSAIVFSNEKLNISDEVIKSLGY